MCLCGCAHTVEGVQQDAKQNAPVVQAAAQQADQSLQQATKSTGKVVTAKLQTLGHETKLAFLSTQIKARIIADQDLNSSSNVVNVQQSPGEVFLQGHVKTAEQKNEATKIAKDAILQDHAEVLVNNELAIKPS